MLIELHRKIFTDESTIGELLIDGSHVAVTLEDKIRDKKIKGKTAIPKGTYEVRIGHSARFNRDMPQILNVPNFSGILIHWGNTAINTEGCILVGKTSSSNFIGSSKLAFNSIFKRLSSTPKGERMSITID